ncbi:MAG: peptidoglycan bridge formation glycyltransferase FemA/FemB family protein [Candidatus Ornithospirochaeta sp.]|nr:peptidoglycan bridge formation glycyltransferase FemA/FemB family protein [Candidatus Ornithospirochaeta sp.]
MKSKTRYNIRLSERRNVTVREGGEEDLPLFMSLYRETAERNGIRSHKEDSFASLFCVDEDDAEVKLLIAERLGEPLAALFLSISDDRASYLYGASSSRGREHMPTYALQMRAMMEAKSRGAREYDLFGIAPEGEMNHPLSGLSRFKLGFGGRRVSRMGCWDYPLSDKAELFFAEEQSWEKYHTR